MPVEALKPYLCEYWPLIREELLAGRYEPKPVLRVEIPKPGGKGMRQLGIPTVLDRLIQQGQCIRYYKLFSTGILPDRATDFVPAAVRTRQYSRHALTWRKAVAG